MKYVGDIARDFNDLMTRSRGYMEGELAKIRGWLDAFTPAKAASRRHFWFDGDHR